MAEIKFPIQVDLPDDWVEQIVNRLRNDPEADWKEIIHCKDCKWYTAGQKGKPWNISKRYCNRSVTIGMNENDYCSRAERKDA